MNEARKTKAERETWADELRGSAAQLRREADALRVAAFDFPHPPASYFVEAGNREREAIHLEAVAGRIPPAPLDPPPPRG